MFNAVNLKVLFLFICTCIFVETNCQTTILHTKVSANLNSTELKQVIQYFEQNYNIPFFYSDDIFKGSEPLNLNLLDVKIEDVLEIMFADYDIAYKIVNGGVVLFYQKKPKKYFNISGTISDKETGELLIGVAIIGSDNKATITNAYGFYSLKLESKNQSLKVSYLGYNNFDTTINLKSNIRFNIELINSDIVLNEINVIENISEDILMSTKINSTILDLKDINSMPGIFGENDVVRNLSVIPGIQQSDISDGGVYVRGGSSDQTVFFMDEAIVYNPSHFGGVFSVFNPDIINSVEIFKGDMPVSDDGAISSSINVHLREGNNKKWKTKGSIGLLAVKGLLEGPVVKDKSSVLVAFRRSYIDLFLKGFNADIEPGINYYFHDLNVKYNLKINNKNRIYVSGYSGSDYLKLLGNLKRTNSTVNFRWNHLYNSNLFSNTSLVFSRSYNQQKSDEPNLTIVWKRYLNNFLLKYDLTYYGIRNSTLKVGVSLNSTELNPFTVETTSPGNQNLIEKAESEMLLIPGSYLTFNTKVFNRLKVNAGIRANYNFNPSQNLEINTNSDSESGRYSKLAFEPRINLRYLVSENVAVKLGYNRQENALHQLQVTDAGIAVNRWVVATEDMKPQISNNFTAGLYLSHLNKLYFEMEGYYRKMDNLLESFQNYNLLTTYDPYEDLYSAKGESLGLETTLKFNHKKVSFLGSYTLSKTRWKVNELNQNNWFDAKHDRPHSISLSTSFKLTKRMSLSALWVYNSGAPYTQAISKYTINNKTMVEFDSEHINTARLPDYHRLDLSLDLAGKKNDRRKWKSYWNFSVYNAYFQMNPYSVQYFTPIEESDSEEYKFDPKYFYFYRFIPSVTYKFEF